MKTAKALLIVAQQCRRLAHYNNIVINVSVVAVFIVVGHFRPGLSTRYLVYVYMYHYTQELKRQYKTGVPNSNEDCYNTTLVIACTELMAKTLLRCTYKYTS